MSPTLSLILCSRNDRYMGNSVWRLETALNYVSARLVELGRADHAEIIVTDWGSATPLHDTVNLTPAAHAIVRFVHVPPAIAVPLQRDSPFPEVIALNAAARRARGRFVGRIDQDTLVGARFLRGFFEIADGTLDIGGLPDDMLFFSNHRRVPYGFASLCPPLDVVERFVGRFGHRFTNDHTNPRAPYYSAGVGIWLLPRAVWNDTRGYDERMIYMNWMEVRMVARLAPRHPMVDLGRLFDFDFYHLEHYHPMALRKSASHRVTNDPRKYDDADNYRQNSEEWGLAAVSVVESRCTTAPRLRDKPVGSVAYGVRLGLISLRLVQDGALRYIGATSRRHWIRRLGLALRIAVTHLPWQWPQAVAAQRERSRAQRALRSRGR